MLKGLLKSLSLALVPALAASVAFAVEIAPEASEKGQSPEQQAGEAEAVVATSSLAGWASFFPFFSGHTASEPVVAEASQPETASVAPSASALASLGSDPDATPLESSGPRRASTFLFEVPGLDKVEVSPN